MEIFSKVEDILYEDSMLIDLVSLFSQKEKINKHGYIAILKSEENKKLIGSLKISNALEYLMAESKIIEEKLRQGKNSTDYRFQKLFKNLDMDNPMELKKTGDSMVIDINKEFQKYLSDLSKTELKYVMNDRGAITAVKN